MIGYDDLRKEQAEKRARGELMGIGISTFTEAVGAGPSKHFDIMGIKMFDSAEIRVHPTGSAILRAGTKSQGQGHETTWAQIAAEELGLDPQNIMVEEGDTDTAPYGLGTYASRSTPVAGAAIAMAARKIRDKAKKIAAHLLEASEDDIEWANYKFRVQAACPTTRSRCKRSPSPRTPTRRRTASRGSKRRSTTIRRTSRSRTAPTSRWSTSTTRPACQGAALPCDRRLRHRHQPDDRRRPDPRRLDRRVRDRVHAGDQVRRERQQPEHELHRLPGADVARDAALGDRRTPSRRARIIRSVRRASARARTWARRQRSSTR